MGRFEPKPYHAAYTSLIRARYYGLKGGFTDDGLHGLSMPANQRTYCSFLRPVCCEIVKAVTYSSIIDLTKMGPILSKGLVHDYKKNLMPYPS